MDKKAALGHVVICLVIGGIVAYFTSAKWLAASFWVSAAMYINGSLAYFEDAQPGGFDNPDGKDAPAFTKGFGAFKFWASSIAVTVTLAIAGWLVQEYAPW